MNLTLKQLFKFGAVCASACALSASATDYVSDSFETADGGSDGMAIGDYKLNVPSAGDTNWYADASDESVIVTNGAYGSYSGDHPIPGTADELILSLDTKGNELSRTAGVSIAGSDIAYVDTLVQFVVSDPAPSVNTNSGTDVKVAMYVNASSNLVVVHNWFDGASYVPTNSVIAAVLPETWYRLSLVSKDLSSGGGTYATQIALDGTVINNANAYTEAFAPGGSWFLNMSSASAISMISFKGTGVLDELLVSDTPPTASVVISLVFAGGSGTFATVAAPGTPVTEVADGTDVIMTAQDWYNITSVDGPIDETITAVPAKAVTNTVTSTSGSDCTVTATVAQVSGDLATWALANGVSEAQADAGTYNDNYLLNVSTSTVPQIVITSITVDGVETTITVGSAGDVVDFATIYGTLIVNESSDLATWGEPTTYGVDLTAPTPEATVVVTNGLEFLKAMVQ